MGGINSREREYEERLRREEAEAKDELRRRETESAQRQAQNERLERERMEGNLKAERAAAQSKAEAARMQMEHQRHLADSKFEREREAVRCAEERENRLSHDKQRLKADIKAAQTREENVRRDMQEETKRLEAERHHLQLEMEKKNCESEKQLTKKEEELRRSQVEASNLLRKMDFEREGYDQKITMKDEEVAEARSRAELIRVEKDKMGENLLRRILEKDDDKDRVRKEAMDMQSALFLQWKNDNDKHHAESMQRELENRKELGSVHNQSREFMLQLQNQAFENQTKQFEMLSMGLKKITGGEQPTAAISNLESSAQTSIKKERIVLCNPCIVMMDNFKQGEVLKFVKKDENIVQDLFKHMQAGVRPVLNGKFLTRSARQCEKENYSANDGIMVFLFSYGNNMTLQDGSRRVDIGRILEIFAKNSSLADKPKIFFVQAMHQTEEENCVEGKLHDGKDYLLCYCEMAEETYIENADDREGSMLIKYLHDAFASNKNCDIDEILEIVEESISYNIKGDYSFKVENKLNAEVELYIP